LTNLTTETILVFNATPHFTIYSDTAVLQPAYNMQMFHCTRKYIPKAHQLFRQQYTTFGSDLKNCKLITINKILI